MPVFEFERLRPRTIARVCVVAQTGSPATNTLSIDVFHSRPERGVNAHNRRARGQRRSVDEHRHNSVDCITERSII